MRCSRSTRRGSQLLGVALNLAIAGVGFTSSQVHSGTADDPIGRFSASLANLPGTAIDAWHATVLIEKRQITCRRKFGHPNLRVKHGSGVVVRVNDSRNLAVIATNAHVVACGGGKCRVRVGFGDAFSADGWRWSGPARVVSMSARNDLAFLETEIPIGATVCAATLGFDTLRGNSTDRFVSIGWPDLTVLKKRVRPLPPNSREYVKRFSCGSFLFAAAQRRLVADADLLAKRARVIYHDAAVLPGSSGGPLVNQEGQVIGINALILSTQRTIHYEHSCSAPDPGRPPDCVPLAVSSKEIIDEYERVYGLRYRPLSFPVIADNDISEHAF